jgi:hypothetical protein
MFGMDFFVFWTMDDRPWIIRSSIVNGRWSNMKGASMDSESDANELEEVYMHEVEIKVPEDRSLPAGQVIAEQSQDVREHLAPRFIP